MVEGLLEAYFDRRSENIKKNQNRQFLGVWDQITLFGHKRQK